MFSRRVVYSIILVIISGLLLIGCEDKPDPNDNVKPSNQNGSASPSSSAPGTPTAGGGNFQGNLDAVTCGSVVGWIWDKRQPNSAIQLDIYDGDTKVDTLTASELRQDLVAAGMGNGIHGFNYPIPARLKDGKPHSIWAAVPGTDYNMYKSAPKKITCP
jgi:hypothetical protein